MPNYRYKAMNQKGERLQGTYKAESEDEVINMISANNYYPLLVEEIQEGTKIELSSFEKVKTKDIAVFCRQFYTMLNAGVTINRSLHILSMQLTNKKLKESVGNIEEEVKKGQTLSEAMKMQGNIFPNLLVSMIETGEVSGNLDSVFLRMSTHYEKENKINNKVKSAMIYPAVLSVVAVVVVVVLLTFIMPTFIDLFTQSGAELPIPTKILLAISGGLRNYGLIIIFIVASIGFLIRYYFRSEAGQLTSSKIKLSLPILKTLNQKIIVSRFTRTLATLLSSGVTLVQALEVVSSVVGNKVAEEILNKVRESVIKGEGLANSISENSIFPPMLSSMIMIGEESGSLDDILNKTADFYDEELETAVQRATAMLEPLLIVVMGVVIGFIIISIMLPMFSMYNNI
ncbi:type II secretion system F family protein [Clostridium sp. 'White wine YQ']|uniref:type II secretion system F family protein n=1 Tax=Clostridium sp. 'White wine YQ' TaxID=3027474 RepID=UPI0023671A66|nr:type II secretion system F family protein [Clostridium sp. 'White wine YQ']MDD7795768.1 type II secretion system F family protein [Clostridium sp. 'White wine YQ']